MGHVIGGVGVSLLEGDKGLVGLLRLFFIFGRLKLIFWFYLLGDFFGIIYHAIIVFVFIFFSVIYFYIYHFFLAFTDSFGLVNEVTGSGISSFK